MPAEKCGDALSIELFEDAVVRALAPPAKASLVISPRAYRVLKKIHHKYPDFSPSIEAEIWVKAYKMGLYEDE